MSTCRIIHGDCREAMAQLKAEGVTVQAVVCDPPYHLTSIVKRFGATDAAPAKSGKTGAYARASKGFMGQQWDGIEMPAMTAELGHWLAGFADGEGCFTTRKSGKGFVCEFIIHLRADDAKILQQLRAATGVGDVSDLEPRADGAAPMARWVVRRQEDCAKLVMLFEHFPLRAKKARDFQIWASAVREWIAHEPGTSWQDLKTHADMLSAVKLYGAAFNPVQFFHLRWARAAYDLLPPGGHLLAFGATRNYHRLAAGVEDAGFEIRDMVAWLYGSGFPKSHNLDGAWEGWGTALKPALEPIVLARKPLTGTVAGTVLAHGTGALNIDACRVETNDGLNGGAYSGGMRRRDEYTSTDSADGAVPLSRLNRGIGDFTQPVGRWPANVVHDGSAEVEAAFPSAPGQQFDLNATGRARPRRIAFGDMAPPLPHQARGDAGSAARFFYAGKADADDRVESKHPTVKPVALMRWLVRLVTPPGGAVLDPFAGTGTTGAACLREGFDAILIEQSAEYVADIRRRIDRMTGKDAPLFAAIADDEPGLPLDGAA